MKKVSWSIVKSIAEQLCEVGAYVLVYTVSSKVMSDVLNNDSFERVGYDDAVYAIMHSSMYSHDKSDAVAALKRNENSAFYKAIVHIAKNSDTYSHDKLSMIKELNQN
jgi:2-hydroxy-3-keto-5-methylthiopentenyl-1-phosphate phosphatase